MQHWAEMGELRLNLAMIPKGIDSRKILKQCFLQKTNFATK